MLRYFFFSLLLVAILVVAAAGWRGQRSAKPPIEIFNDMDHQPKMQPQHKSEFYADGRAARAPVAGTVPIGYVMPGIYDTNGASNSKLVDHGASGFSSGTGYYTTGKIGDSYGDGFPKEMPLSRPLMERGRERFHIHCSACHSEVGDGNGIVKQLGMGTVATLQDERIRKMPEGQIFNTITHGKNTMGSYGGQIAVEDRWAIIAYLRALQRSQNSTVADLSEAERAELNKPAALTEAKK